MTFIVMAFPETHAHMHTHPNRAFSCTKQINIIIQTVDLLCTTS